MLVEQGRQGDQVELREHHELHERHDLTHPLDLLSQAVERRLGVAEDGRRLKRGDGEQPHYEPIACWKASVTSWPSSPPSTGSKLQLAVNSSLGTISSLFASAGSRLRRISFTPATGVT